MDLISNYNIFIKQAGSKFDGSRKIFLQVLESVGSIKLDACQINSKTKAWLRDFFVVIRAPIKAKQRISTH